MTALTPEDAVLLVLELRLDARLARDPNAAAAATARLLEYAGELGIAVQARAAQPKLEQRRKVRFEIG